MLSPNLLDRQTMTAAVDLSPYGTHRPGPLPQAMLAVTRSLPANWLGLRLSMPLRRMAINALGNRPIDTTLWNARMRLYPSRNSCEKNALFTPQMFDLHERNVLAAALDRVAAGESFTFVDIGANVGLYSLFVAARGGACARVLAIEPQPGILERLTYNRQANPDLNIEIVPCAVADREGEFELLIDARDSGGTRLNKGNAALDGESVRARCRPLLTILRDAGIAAVDALKIDIEGAEDWALAPFLREAPDALLPRLILIEDRPEDWTVDLYALLRERGYAVASRSRINVMLERGAAVSASPSARAGMS
jgi:FkbM family methyltransferase